MSKESYIRGFCKAAETAGIDPEGLAKFASMAAQAQQKANLAAMRPKIQAMLRKHMQGSRIGETRRFSPELQKKVDAFLQSGGKPEDLNIK